MGLSSPFSATTVANPTVTTNYTLTQVISGTFGTVTNTAGITVVVIPPPSSVIPVSISITPSVICVGSTATLNASGPSGPFLIQPNNVFSSGSLTVSPSASTIYTVTGNFSGGCPVTATANLIVEYPNEINVNVSNNQVCATTNVTATVGPPTLTYTWLPTSLTGTSVVLSPTATTIYTVIATTSNVCSLSSGTFQINYVSCKCLEGFPYDGSVYEFTPVVTPPTLVPPVISVIGTITIPSGVNKTFLQIDMRMYNNAQINVSPNSTLNIVASHIYACDQMWNGILVKPGGVVNITTAGKFGGRTTLIEDAKVAIDFEPYGTTSPTMTSILNANNATFNKNLISIRLNNYNKNQTTYPYQLNGCLFTCRNIPYSVLTWVNTQTVKNSASGNTSPLQTPYIDNAAYTPTFLIAPFAGQSPLYGININNNGFSNTPTTLGFNFFGATFGTNGNPNFNCFDNLRTDIYAVNSNLTVINSVFQNGRRVGKFVSANGGAIYAESFTGNDEGPWNNNVINIVSGSNNFNNNNRFYEKTYCATIVGYYKTDIRHAECFSFINNNSGIIGPNPFGNLGFNIKTNRYLDIFVRNSKLYNIRNSVVINLDIGNYNVGPYVGLGKLVGVINVDNNIINQHPTVPTGTEFCNIGVVVNDLFTASPIQTSPGPVFTSINNNLISRVANGIEVNNIGFSQVNIYENVVTMLNAPSVIATTQNGITANQNRVAQILKNNISGPITFTNDISAVKTSMNQIWRCVVIQPQTLTMA